MRGKTVINAICNYTMKRFFTQTKYNILKATAVWALEFWTRLAQRRISTTTSHREPPPKTKGEPVCMLIAHVFFNSWVLYETQRIPGSVSRVVEHQTDTRKKFSWEFFFTQRCNIFDLHRLVKHKRASSDQDVMTLWPNVQCEFFFRFKFCTACFVSCL